MAKDLVTLEQAKAHILVIHDQDDAHIQLSIAAASAAVITYLDGAEEVFMDSAGDVDLALVPDDIKWATLLLIGEFFKSREAEQDGEISQAWGYGYLPRPIVALLFPHRENVIS